ncbi:response regulator [Enterovirga rhinocerotis]|uniref:Winged helix family two component transcriptional regulator n=1 Tax=Enterovirga rhinocerotis TaxID=1339210 RepID=A0A4R7BJW7_9HYPH|nr:response regulator [Enterovirga rhinocerotis]TDR84495.1 winged helix family two component transcriptional regulator [Enterovirga rhinocerotis]
MRILVVEDDPILADGLRAGLALKGSATDVVATCEDAEAALSTTRYAAVVLDIMLPDGSGVDLLRRLRRKRDTTPVLLLTARDAIEDKVGGLDAGADDYLAKPFDLDELAARLRAITRRESGRAESQFEHGNITLHPVDLSVTVEGHAVTLSRREFALLSALMERPSQVRSRAELEDVLYGWQEEVESNALEVHIHHLRNKIGRDAIETLRGLGYRMRAVR